jgi:hypothetical protein
LSAEEKHEEGDDGGIMCAKGGERSEKQRGRNPEMRNDFIER